MTELLSFKGRISLQKFRFVRSLIVHERKRVMGISPISIETWMNDNATGNPLQNLARVNALLASVMGGLVNNQKLVVEDVAAKIKVIGELNVRVKKLANIVDSKPDAPLPFGTSPADSEDLLTQLKAVGVKNMDFWLNELKTKWAPFGFALPANNQFVSNISLELQTLSESQQNVSQQESLRLQTLTNRYTQATDQASAVIQKDGQNKGTVTNNLRGSGG